MSAEQREVGKTADVGYQIGVRRTLPLAEEALWSALLSPDGLTAWLGGPIDLVDDARYTLADGTVGEVRVHKPWSHLRLTWQPPGWSRPSTIQVRITPARTGTTISFHQEHLPDATTRAAMRARWEAAIDHLAHLAAGKG